MTDESPDIGALRRQIKELTKEKKTRDAEDEALRAEIRDQLIREQSIEGHLADLGHPAGMRDALALGDGEVTRESVSDALGELGYEVNVEQQQHAPGPSHPDLESITKLGASVNAASQTGRAPDVMQQIAQAKDQDELNALMAKQGLLSNG